MIVGLLFLLFVIIGTVLGLYVLFGLWGIAMFLLGFVAYILLPIVSGVVRSDYRIGDFYLKTGFRYLGRCLLIARKNGGYALVGSSSNQAYQPPTERASIDGKTGDWEDPNGAMSHLKGQAFGVATDYRGMIFDPIMAEIGRRVDDLVRAGWRRREISVNYGTVDEPRMETETHMAKYVDLAKNMTPVDVRDASKFIPGSADPFSASVGEEFATQSQEMFSRPFDKVQAGLWLVGYLVGVGVMWAVMSFGGGGGAAGAENATDGGSVVPILLGGLF